jgi:hypothetical protein
MRRLTMLMAILILPAFACNCSIVMASRQPDKKNVRLLDKGTYRSQVIAEFGNPTRTRIEDGRVCDTFIFRQGYGKGAKWARGVVHGMADIFSIGLWEAVGVPIELIADGEEVQLDVLYDPHQQIAAIRVGKGSEVLKGVDSLADDISANKDPTDHLSPAGEQKGMEREKGHPDPFQSSVTEAADEIKGQTIGVVAMDRIEISSPNIRSQWLRKATGIGDWLTQPPQGRKIQGSSPGSAGEYAAGLLLFPLAYYAAVLATGAYTLVYLPVAAATGAVAGEIDAFEWRACEEPFAKRISDAELVNIFIQSLENMNAHAEALPKSNDFLQIASSRGIKHVLLFKTFETGLETCDSLGRFALNIATSACLWDVEAGKVVFDKSYTKKSYVCMRLDSYCASDPSGFLESEFTRLIQRLAATIMEDIPSTVD